MTKPVYLPTVAETPLAVDRTTAWAALLDLVEVAELADTTQRRVGSSLISETAISVEPPWRLVLDADDPPTGFHQESVVLVPDRRGCLAMWSALVLEPTDRAAGAYASAVANQIPGRLADLAARVG